jgi:putative hemolysin
MDPTKLGLVLHARRAANIPAFQGLQVSLLVDLTHGRVRNRRGTAMDSVNQAAAMGLGTSLLVLAGLLLLNSVLSLSELAVVASRKSKLKQLAKESVRARAALELAEKPEKFLSTIQIAITLLELITGLVSGWIGIAIGQIFRQHGLFANAAATVGLTVTLTAVTFVSILIGELIPKRIALIAPEKIATIIAVPMLFATRVVAPIAAVLVWLSTVILRLLRLDKHSASEVSEEEIQMLVDESAEAGVIDHVERSMVNRVLTLGDRTVASIMTPRTRIAWLDTQAPLEENLAVMRAAPFSRYPVIQGSDKDVVGVLETKHLINYVGSNGDIRLFEKMSKPIFVPESMSAPNLVEQLRDEAVFMAFVVDEYGDLQGMVTLNDLLHAVLGSSSQATTSDAAQIVEREDGSYLVDGRLSLEDLRELLEVQELPHEDEHSFNTLAGLLMAQFGRIPAPADYFEWRAWRFEVLDLDGPRIDKALISRVVHARNAAE